MPQLYSDGYMISLSQRDQAVIWHPFTQHRVSPLAIPVAAGEGAFLLDSQGRKYLDLVSSWWVNIHGHSNPTIAKAIYEQALRLEHVIFAGFTHEPAVELAEKILKVLPPVFSKVFYSDNGSTAVEVAIKMAYQFWCNQGQKDRSRFLAFSGGYHGDTFGAMSMGHSSKFFNHFTDLLFSVDIAPYPATWKGDSETEIREQQALQWIEHYFRQHANTLAAIIIEPLIQGASGMNICRPEFLRSLEQLARQYHVLTIYDEIMTGFGRTGALFACEKAGTQPDIICLAKGLTGGFLPLAVTVCQKHIYNAFLSSDISHALVHGHSYTANPLGCAAGIASLQLLLEPAIQNKIQVIETTHQEMLEKLAVETKVEKIRQCGTIAAFNVAAPAAYGSRTSYQWQKKFLERGLLIRPLGNVIYLLPPYCLGEEELRNAYREIIKILSTI